MEHIGELAGIAGTLWGAWQTFQRRRAAARAELERRLEAQRREALAAQLEAVAELAGRFAAALERGDLAAMRALERERKARGL